MALTAGHAQHDLAESLAPALTLRQILAVSDADPIGDLELDYGTPAGGTELREILAEQHGVSPDSIIVTAGGMHAIFLVAMMTCGPGDRALLTVPAFPVAEAALDAAGAVVDYVGQSFAEGYVLRLEEFQAKLTSRTRLVYIATPQNPSGVSISQGLVAALSEAMLEICPTAVLLVDETYRTATYGTPSPASVATLAPNVVATSSVSKLHGAAGLRIGWVIAQEPRLRDQLLHGKYTTILSCSPLDEALASRVLASDAVRARQVEHLRVTRKITEGWVGEHRPLIDWIPPDGGGLCCIRLDPTAFDLRAVERFHVLLSELGCRVAPGPWFGDEAHVFRLGFGYLSPNDLTAALTTVSAVLNKSVSQ